VVAVSLMGRDPGPPRTTVSDADRATTGLLPSVVNAMGEAVEGAVEGVTGFIDRVTGRSGEAADGMATEDPSEEKKRISQLGRSPEPLPKGLTRVDMMTMALNTMQASIEHTRTAINPPDVLVSVPASSAATFDFHRADEIIQNGRLLTAEALDRAGF
nr:hypothetical protein [Actinomycetales bacterium]